MIPEKCFLEVRTSYFQKAICLLAFDSMYGKCPKISYTKVSDKNAYANSGPRLEQSDQDLHCLSFH